MNKKHTKSPCCQGKVIRFGERRRQCYLCKKTWRIRKKKTGKKKQRVQIGLAESFLKNERLSCFAIARKFNKSEDALNRKLKKSLIKFVSQTSYPKLPTKRPIVVIADAMMQQVEGKLFSIYFILVKTPNFKKAIIAPAHFEEGNESWIGWKNAFDSLPKPIFNSIKMIVSDGHKGLISLALRNGWLMQRCHFHLLASLQGRRSRGKFSRHRKIGEAVFQLVKIVITSRNEKEIRSAIDRLKKIKTDTDSPGLKRILRGFLKNYKQFRIFIDYPEFNLPRTSNSAESLIGCVRSLLRKTKGFRSFDSFKIWIEALIKSKKSVTNNGFHQPS